MDTIIKGKAFVLGNNIDTDQIIPAHYLSYNPSISDERKFFGKFALSGVPIAQSGLPDGNIHFVTDGVFKSEYQIVIAGRNFGCGSSREHAPLALMEAGIKAVVSLSYARIFYRNSVNGGYLLPIESEIDLSQVIKTGDSVFIDVNTNILRIDEAGQIFKLKSLGNIRDILEAGDIFKYAKKEKSHE